jgi:putative peptidoglycan lipid II flippase
LQARERFVLAGLRPLCWYGGALGALLVLGPRWGAGAVPVGMIAGVIVFCVALVRAGSVADGRAAGAGSTTAGAGRPALAPLLVPLVLASTANYVNVGVERALAARLPEGSLAALTYAFRLVHFPVTLVLMNATTILLPALSMHAARQESRPLADMLGRALRLALLFAIPLAALSVALAEPVIQLLLERGAFTSQSTRLTATALVWYAPSLIGVAGVQVLARGYQALQAIPRMAGIGIAAVALNLVLMPALTAALGFRGLPLATSTTTVVLLAAMLLGLRARLPGLASRRVVESVVRTGAAALAAMVSAWLVRDAVGASALARFVAGAAAGVAVYACVLWWLARDDARLALDFVMPLRWRRASTPCAC